MGVVLMRSGAMDDACRRAILWLLGKCRVRLCAVSEQRTFALSLTFVPRKHGGRRCERSRFATSAAEPEGCKPFFSGIALFDDIILYPEYGDSCEDHNDKAIASGNIA